LASTSDADIWLAEPAAAPPVPALEPDVLPGDMVDEPEADEPPALMPDEPEVVPEPELSASERAGLWDWSALLLPAPPA
jgi:hypothetical protein